MRKIASKAALKLCVGGACDLESCQAKDQVLWTLMAHDVACTSIQDPQLYARASQNQELSSGHFPEILLPRLLMRWLIQISS